MDKETYGIKLSMDLSDFNKSVKKVQEKTKDIEKDVEVKVKINNPFDKKYDFTGKFKNLGLEELNSKLKETEDRLQKLFNKAYKEAYNEITGVHEIIPIGSQEQLDAYKEKLEEVMELRDELQGRDTTGSMSAEEKNSYLNNLEEQAKIASMSIDELRQKLLTLQATKAGIENKGIATDEDRQRIEKINQEIEKYKQFIVQRGGTIPKVVHKEDIKDIQEVNEELEKTSKNITAISVKTSISGGTNLSKMFTKATKSLKRFALSLFGIRSIWAMLSRGVRTYMAQNEKLKSTMEGIWSAFGTLMAPVAELVANVFLKILGYINEMTKALFGFNFIAKSNQAIMEKYNKQLAKSQKALSGFDEINNLTQNQDEGPQGIIDEDKLGLNEGLVKKLQDISYWLKDNWDWLGKVLLAVGLLFGAGAVANWLGNIGKLLGGAGTGLIGFSSILSSIATLGIIVVGVDLVYKGITGRDLVQDIIDIKDGIKDLKKANKDQQKVNKENYKNTLDNADAMDILSKNYETGSKETANYVANIQSVLEMNEANIKENKEYADSLGVVGNMLFYNSETMKTNRESTKQSKEEIERLVISYSNLYKRGQLTIDQTKEYKDWMARLGYNIDGTKMSTQDYNRYLKEQEEKQKKVNDATSAGAGLLEATGTVLDELKNKAYIYGNALGQLAGNPYLITINSILNPPDTRAYINALNDVIWRLNQNDGARMIATGSAIGSLTTMALNRIPYLSIGTDLVRSEGLAYLHAGERVVPADVVGGGYSGDSEETNSLLRTLIEVIQDKEFSATIGADEVGKASVNYIRNQNRIMGGSVI